MQIRFRGMTPDDVIGIIDVHKKSIHALCKGSYSEEQMTVWTNMFEQKIPDGIANPDNIGIVALQDDMIVGYGFFNKQDGEIKGIYLVPDITKNGIGRMILTKLESIAKEHGLEELALDSTLNAVAFYEKCGYVRIRDRSFPLTGNCKLACVHMTKRFKIPL